MTIGELDTIGASATVNAADGRAERVLYIEDSVVNTRLVKRIFARMLPAVELVTAPDGETGLTMLVEAEPDVVLLDCHLPGVSGLEVLQSARSAGNAVPVVVVTADVSPDLEARFVAAGAEDFLTKPFEFSTLVSRVTQHLNSRSNETRPGRSSERA